MLRPQNLYQGNSDTAMASRELRSVEHFLGYQFTYRKALAVLAVISLMVSVLQLEQNRAYGQSSHDAAKSFCVSITSGFGVVFLYRLYLAKTLRMSVFGATLIRVRRRKRATRGGQLRSPSLQPVSVSPSAAGRESPLPNGITRQSTTDSIDVRQYSDFAPFGEADDATIAQVAAQAQREMAEDNPFVPVTGFRLILGSPNMVPMCLEMLTWIIHQPPFLAKVWSDAPVLDFFLLFRLYSVLLWARNATLGRSLFTRVMSHFAGIPLDSFFFLRVIFIRFPWMTPVVLCLGSWLILAILYASVENVGFFESAYFIVVTASTIGYGDITPQSVRGKVIVIVAWLCGCVLVGWVIMQVHDVLRLSPREQAFFDLLELHRRSTETQRLAAETIQAAWRVHRAHGLQRTRLIWRYNGVATVFRKELRNFRQFVAAQPSGSIVRRHESAVASLAELHQPEPPSARKPPVFGSSPSSPKGGMGSRATSFLNAPGATKGIARSADVDALSRRMEAMEQQLAAIHSLLLQQQPGNPSHTEERQPTVRLQLPERVSSRTPQFDTPALGPVAHSHDDDAGNEEEMQRIVTDE